MMIIQNTVERFFFRACIVIIPSVYVFRVMMEYIDTGHAHAVFDWVKIPTEIALIIALLFSKRLFTAFPHEFSQLFTYHILVSHSGQANHDDYSQASYTKQFEQWLNHWYRIGVGGLASLTVFTYYIARIGGITVLLEEASWSLDYLDLLLYIFPSVFYAYFVGIVVWKLLVISLFLQRLTKHFYVNMQFGHPDGAGGLLPIGLLSLQIMYVTAVPTILSAWILIAPVLATFTSSYMPVANRVLLFGFAPIILAAGICGSLLGLFPILRFHQVMLEHQEEMMKALNQVSEKIVQLKKNFVDSAENHDDKETTALLKKISDLESFYKSHQTINTWPLNQPVLIKIWTTQAFLYGQVMGLWKVILQVMKAQ